MGATTAVSERLLPDRYDLQARWVPAGLVLAPLYVTCVTYLPVSPPTMIPIGLLVVLTLIIGADLARRAGRRAETTRWRAQGGAPSTRALRHREAADPDVHQRLHHLLTRATGVPLPSAAEEAADPEKADSAYFTAVRSLRAQTRGRTPLVLAENTTYGMFRNFYGLKPYGVTTALIGTAAALVGLLIETAGLWPVIVNGVLLLCWTPMTGARVEDAGKEWVDRIFESLEEPTTYS